MKTTLLFLTVIWITVVSVGRLAISQDTPPTKSANIDPSNYSKLRTGDTDGLRTVVPTNQVLAPAGRQVAFSGRPTDLALSPDGRWLAFLDRTQVGIINPQSGEVVERSPLSGGSYAGLLFSATASGCSLRA